jgi:hypothetical protein
VHEPDCGNDQAGEHPSQRPAESHGGEILHDAHDRDNHGDADGDDGHQNDGYRGFIQL